MEEERRLCYVGITRAKKDLFLTCSKQRTIFGSTSCNSISRFVREIPEELLDGAEKVFGESREVSFDDNPFGNSSYSWGYGKPKESAIKTYKIEPSTYEKKTEAASSFGSGMAAFGRTAESFLNGLANKGKSKVDIYQYKEGIKVYHKKFGEGIITKTEPEGDDLKVDITFDKFGHKRLMAKFSNLEIIE